MDLGFIPLKKNHGFVLFDLLGWLLVTNCYSRASRAGPDEKSALLKIWDFTSSWWLYCFWEKIGTSTWTIFAQAHGACDFTRHRHTSTSKPRPTLWTCANKTLNLKCCVRWKYASYHLIPFGYLWVTSTAMIKNYQKLMVFSAWAEISRAKLGTN